MKKFKILASMLCMCTMLSAPLTSLAATEPNIQSTEVSLYASVDGYITESAVYFRGQFDPTLIIGQVYKGEAFVVLGREYMEYNGYEYILVQMVTGYNAGKIGAVARIYTTY